LQEFQASTEEKSKSSGNTKDFHLCIMSRETGVLNSEFRCPMPMPLFPWLSRINHAIFEGLHVVDLLRIHLLEKALGEKEKKKDSA
jgi:hypothetical protein